MSHYSASVPSARMRRCRRLGVISR
jgi:hypothetical protein